VNFKALSRPIGRARTLLG